MNEHDYLDTEANERARLEEVKRKQAARETEIEDIKWLMGVAQGRRFILKRITDAGVFKPSFHSDPMVMSFNEGQRNDGLRLLNDVVTHSPDGYALMMQEGRSK